MTNYAIEDIRKEPLLKKDWSFKAIQSHEYAKGILITGPNSFIGCHVIKELLKTWNDEIHLLIRASHKDSAIHKMKDGFSAWKLGPFKSERFHIHCGDVCELNMGLTQKEIKAIQTSTGTVLHLAMNPLYHLRYKYFKQQWLPELEQMIRFCGDNIYPKRLHYPSSYNANFFTCEEDFNQLNTNAWQSGYAGFKWLANKVLENAFQQNLKGCLYDIPLVVGSLKRGLCPDNYSMWHILGLFRETGFYIDFEFKIIPVDTLAKVVVSNIIADSKNMGSQFIRPVLKDAVNEKLINKTMAMILGLKHSTRDILMQACTHKRKCNFMIPANFNELLEKVNHLNAVWPESFDIETFPSTKSVFQSNIKRVLMSFKRMNTH